MRAVSSFVVITCPATPRHSGSWSYVLALLQNSDLAGRLEHSEFGPDALRTSTTGVHVLRPGRHGLHAQPDKLLLLNPAFPCRRIDIALMDQAYLGTPVSRDSARVAAVGSSGFAVHRT